MLIGVVGLDNMWYSAENPLWQSHFCCDDHARSSDISYINKQANLNPLTSEDVLTTTKSREIQAVHLTLCFSPTGSKTRKNVSLNRKYLHKQDTVLHT